MGPEAREVSVTTGGSGGTSAGGMQGHSALTEWITGGGGKQGAVVSSRGFSDQISMPIVFSNRG